METIQGISEFNKSDATIVTIGTFDGVHVGHQTILKRLINNAKKEGLKSAVLTFFPHPRMVLQKDSDLKLLNTLEEKKQILESLGLDYLVVHKFTKEFSRLSATDFVRDVLVNRLKVKKIIIGYDHRFGRNRNANIKDLVAFGETFDFLVEEIPVQEINEVSVSSTKIRNAIIEGDMPTANNYLGYNYIITGLVIKGKGLGRKLGYPTANIEIAENYKLIPKNGVYAVKCQILGRFVHGMMNIGVNPTVAEEGSNDPKKHIEVHFFNLDENLYGQQLTIEILARLRDEQKFESVDQLRDQLEKDKENALHLISTHLAN